MRAPPNQLRPRGYTLVEVLTVCTIISILAALALPSMVGTVKKARRVKCANNLRQIGIAFASFAHDHGDRYPQQVPYIEGGSRDQNLEAPVLSGQYVLSPLAFMAASSGLTPQVMVCPATKIWVSSFSSLNLTNLCYALNLYGEPGSSSSVLATDSHLLGDWAQFKKNVIDKNQSQILFANSRHDSKGNVVFGDGHVELQKGLEVTPAQIASAVQAIKSLNNPPKVGTPTARPPTEKQRQEAFAAANPAGNGGDFGANKVAEVAVRRNDAVGELALLDRLPSQPLAKAAMPRQLAMVRVIEDLPAPVTAVSHTEVALRRSLLWFWLILALLGATLVWWHYHRERQRRVARTERWAAYAREHEQERTERLQARLGRS